MITIDQIKEAAEFKTAKGVTFIVDEIDGSLVSSSLEGGRKGNYRDSISEFVEFLNDEKSVLLMDSDESFIKNSEFVNTGGHIMNDVVTLRNGYIIRISDEGLSVYKDADADENGEQIAFVNF